MENDSASLHRLFKLPLLSLRKLKLNGEIPFILFRIFVGIIQIKNPEEIRNPSEFLYFTIADRIWNVKKFLNQTTIKNISFIRINIMDNGHLISGKSSFCKPKDCKVLKSRGFRFQKNICTIAPNLSSSFTI